MMRGESSFLQRLLQFAVLFAVGWLLLFASARAQTGPVVEQRLLGALQAGDRAALIQMLAGDVRTTAVGPSGAPLTLVGPASALGYLDGWRAGAGHGLRFGTAARRMEGSRLSLLVARTATAEASTPAASGLRIEIENDRIILISAAASL